MNHIPSADDLTYSQRRAARRFQKTRAEFYEDLSTLLATSDRKLLEIFELDAVRYAGTPRGIITGLWGQRLIENGANLAQAWQGTMPDDEVAILKVQQDAGHDAIPGTLKDLARLARLSDTVLSETRGTVGVGVVALVIGLSAVTIFPMFAVDQLKASLDIPVSYWGSAGRNLAAWSDAVRSNLVAALAVFAALIGWIVWSVRNWTGPTRARADNAIVLYRTLRDLSAVRFLDIMSTLTRKRGNVMYTLNVAIEQLAASSFSPWMQWRLEQILTRIEETGANGCDVFDTGILSKEMFWRLRDVEEGRGFAEAFNVTGHYVAGSLVPRLIKRLTFWRWVMMMSAVFLAAGMVIWMQVTSSEMRNAAMNFMGN